MNKNINYKECILELTRIEDNKYICGIFFDGKCEGVSFEVGNKESIKKLFFKRYNIKLVNN